MGRKLFDISMTIESGMITWPGDGPVRVDRVRSMEDGERLNLSRLDMSAHTGTHIDAPVHFIRGGDGVDSIALEILIGPAVVLSVPGVSQIGAHALKKAGIPAGTVRLLLRTANSALLAKGEFDEDFSYITPDGARYLVDQGVRLVGVDYLSVAQYHKGDEVHGILLGAGTVIVEGLDFGDVGDGHYRMTALPLKVKGCDGAPARVILEELKSENRNSE